MNENVKEKTLKTLKGLKTIADELGCSQAALAIAWCLRYEKVTTVIIGASNLSQLEQNFTALSVLEKITDEYEKKILELLDNTPEPLMDYRAYKSRKPQR